MKAILPLILFLLLFSLTKAQVRAGIPDGLIYRSLDIVLKDSINLGSAEPSRELLDSIDLTGDGRADVWFRTNLVNYIDYAGGMVSVSAPGSAVQIMGADERASRLDAGTLVATDSSWGAGGAFVTAHTSFGIPVKDGQWLQDSIGFMGLRILQDGDTLNGWMEVYAVAGLDFVDLRVSGYALENPTKGDRRPVLERLTIVPNPASRQVSLYPPNLPRVDFHLRWYDCMGRLLDHGRYSVVNRWPVSAYAPGVYFVEILNSSGEVLKREKVVVCR